MRMVPNKPRILRAQSYDGDGWICYAMGNPLGTGFGKTPKLAYQDWLSPNSFFKYWTQGEGMEKRLRPFIACNCDDGPALCCPVHGTDDVSDIEVCP